ncbi:MAG: VC_2705 family sodium/solute symporter, partial [Planctomycetes bacterium]|nr:VC_2705 family sodium/solute symporter [Planctomycetota bacterium]
AQYCVLIFAFMVPAFFISMNMTGNPIPQIGLFGTMENSDISLLAKLDGLCTDLGFREYTTGGRSTLNMFCLTAALMFGTAGLPHVIIRFFTVPKVRDARKSAGYALLFIALLYTTAPAIAVFARIQLVDPKSDNSIVDRKYDEVAPWFTTWEDSGVIAWADKNGDGIVNYSGSGQNADGKYTKAPAFAGKPAYVENADGTAARGEHGQRLVSNTLTDNANEVYIDKDIMVLANPEMNGLPNWVTALVAAGGLAAALSTAAGLLLVISVSVSHDLMKKTFKPDITEKQELFYARAAAAVAVVIAGLFGIYPPGFVAQTVAFAFGLAAASFFPAIILGVFSKRVNKEGAIAGMVVGLVFTASYISYFTWISTAAVKGYWFGITPDGIGALGMVMNMFVTIVVTKFTPAPPQEVQDMVEDIRIPKGASAASDH